MDNRIKWLDSVRGLCMFAVFLSHLSSVHCPYYSYIYAPFFLVLFFFISGLLYKKDSLIQSLKRVLRGLVVPYFLLSVIYVFFSLSFVRSISNHTVFSYLWEVFLRIIRGDLFWFITCMIVVQTVYSFLQLVFSKLRINDIYLKITVTVLGLLSIFVIRRVENGSLLWSIDTAVYALGWFALGDLCKTLPHNWFQGVKYRKILSVAVLLSYIAIVLLIDWNTLHIKYDMGNNRFDNPAIQLALSLLGSFAICVIAQNFKLGYYLPLLGKHTLVGYCLHSSIGFGIVSLVFRVLHLDFLGDYPYFYSVIFCYLVGWIVIGISVLLNKYLPLVVGKKLKTQKESIIKG